MNLKLFTLISSAFLLVGCATTEYKPLPEASKVTQPKVQQPKGIQHKVKKGQTLFRIAKSYGVSIEDLIAANNIPNAAAIEVGQLIVIPGAKEPKDLEAAHTPDQNKDEFAWPIKGKIISYYNDHRGEGVNKGIDIEVSEGDTIKAAREGNVVLADYISQYHETVMIDHGDGFISVYAKNRKLLVKDGDHVLKGDPIAEAGTEGHTSILHFEIRKGKEATNPLYYLS